MAIGSCEMPYHLFLRSHIHILTSFSSRYALYVELRPIHPGCGAV
jgi:hypothetical protein